MAWAGMRARFSLCYSGLYPSCIEGGLVPRAVTLERALLANGIGPLEYPVLPRRQSRKNLGLHGFGTGKPQISFHRGERVGREARALLEEYTDLVVPIDVVERESDKAKLLRRLCINVSPDLFPGFFQIGRIRQKSAL